MFCGGEREEIDRFKPKLEITRTTDLRAARKKKGESKLYESRASGLVPVRHRAAVRRSVHALMRSAERLVGLDEIGLGEGLVEPPAGGRGAGDDGRRA